MNDPTAPRNAAGRVEGCGRKGAVCAVLLSVAACSGCGRETLELPAERTRSVSATFLNGPSPSNEAYDELFLYFLEGFQRYRRGDGSAAEYPGLPSSHGPSIDAMEGFTRFAPLAAAWIGSGRPSEVVLPSGERVDLVALVRNGIIAGTNPASQSFWGGIVDYDQRLCEAADVAVALWLTRQRIWKVLSTAERSRIAAWLRQGTGRRVADNNWHLLVVVITVVLRDLGEPSDLLSATLHYQRFRTFYRGDGWFSDGPDGVFDFYNAWAIHYELWWISEIDRSWDPQFIAASRDAFLKTYRSIIARDGVPILGRSVCYRGAVAAPLVLGAAGGSAMVTPGEARRAMDLTWQAFIQKGVLDRGGVSQGYCGADPRVLDNYSGPASCLWSLRSLVAAYTLPTDAAFWQSPPEPLPIDRGDFRLVLGAPKWEVLGDHEKGSVTIHLADGLPPGQTGLRGENVLERLKTLLVGRPHRPANVGAKYKRGVYSSAEPFTECALP